MKVPFFRFTPGGHEQEYVRQVIASGWLTTAGKTLEFEKAFAQQVGAKYACAVNSCTAALHLAAEAVGIGPGDKVLVPTMTFTATAEVIRYLGADPVFVDVAYGSCLLTPAILEQALAQQPDIKAAMVVHFGGQAAQLTDVQPATAPGILSLCRARGIKVIEDAAHAFPTRHHGRMVGSFGDISCFSFYANKTITTGEGGMLTTEDEAIYKRVKTMRLHGINRDIWDRFTAAKSNWEYDVVAPGFKYNMPDINAAIGLAQLERADFLRQERQRCLEYYFKHLAGNPFLDLPVITGSLSEHSGHLFWIVLKPSAPLSRNALIEKLNEAGVGTSVHYKPLHRMTYYREKYQLKPEDYPQAERHWQGVVTLPVYPSMSEAELAYVVTSINQALGG